MIFKLQQGGPLLGMTGIIFQSELAKFPVEGTVQAVAPCPFAKCLLLHDSKAGSGVKRKSSENVLETWHC